VMILYLITNKPKLPIKEDARQLSAQAQQEKRKQAIRLHQQGYRYKAIGELWGFILKPWANGFAAIANTGCPVLMRKARGATRWID